MLKKSFLGTIWLFGVVLMLQSCSLHVLHDQSNTDNGNHQTKVAPSTIRVSVASNGIQADGYSSGASISADGQYVVFSSEASNLVAGGPHLDGEGNVIGDVYIHNNKTNVTEIVSVASDGTRANDWSGTPAISADGRYVAFYSSATNLVDEEVGTDENGDSLGGIFIHDTKTGETVLVNVASDGTPANDYSGSKMGLSISADGRYVTFGSSATNLVDNDNNGQFDVFVHDMLTGTNTIVSVASDGTEADGTSDGGRISADGRYVAFLSWASNLVDNDSNGFNDIFVHDMLTGETTRISVASDGTEANADCNDIPSISADGRYVAFGSSATNLVEGITNIDNNGNPASNMFVHDTLTGVTTRINVASDGTQANNNSGGGTISANGRYVAFQSFASNLVADDNNVDTDGNPITDIFVHDTLTGITTIVSVASDGTQANGHSNGPSISADGRYVAFGSMASNLVTGDTNVDADGNPLSDIFIRDRGWPLN